MTNQSHIQTADRRVAPPDARGGSFALRYVGDRFAHGGLPLDMLSDLTALRDLTIALAKQEFLRKHPDQPEVSRGFDKAISFHLTDVDKGSAIRVMTFQSDVARRNLPKIGDEMNEIVAEAFDSILDIYDYAAHDTFPKSLPEAALQAMSKLGANIRDNERVEFQGSTGRDRDGKVVMLDSRRRKHLLNFYRREKPRARKFDGIGTLVGIDAIDNSIQIQTEKHGKIRLRLSRFSMSASRFDGNLLAPIKISISITAAADGKFKDVDKIHSLDIVHPRDESVAKCLERLRELSIIEKGWLGNDHGEKIAPLAAWRAAHLISTRPNYASLFRIYPTEDGGVSLEFEKGDWNFGIEIMPNGSIEIDRRVSAKKIFEIESFDGLSKDFFGKFDEMTSVS